MNVHGGGGGGVGTLTYYKIMGGGGQDEKIDDVVKTGIDYTRILILKVTKRRRAFNAHVQSENRLLDPLLYMGRNLKFAPSL